MRFLIRIAEGSQPGLVREGDGGGAIADADEFERWSPSIARKKLDLLAGFAFVP